MSTIVVHPVNTLTEAKELCAELTCQLGWRSHDMSHTARGDGRKVVVSLGTDCVYIVSSDWIGRGHDIVHTSDIGV